MDTTSKLELIASDMHLEPAEEYRPPGPSGSHLPEAAHELAPCGHSPAELRSTFDSSLPSSGVLSAAKDLAGGGGGGLEPKKNSLGIHNAIMPGGKRIALLKTLLTSACELDCHYCPFRARRNFRRATFKPEEMAQAFGDMHRVGLVQGMFLSSGIAGGGIRTQDRLIATAEILRKKLGYRGYLHLKIMPGAERDQVERTMQLADRVSVNLEAPNSLRLQTLAPHKQFVEQLLEPLKWMEEVRRTRPAHLAWNGRWPSSVTQFVVGGAGESDLEILTTTAHLYRDMRLARTYFSAFSPVRDTPFENLPAENPLREHRLYQSSFLIREYGFDLEDLPFTRAGNLPLDSDPKLAWARAHLSESPVEVNLAGRRELLRIPGIGPAGVQAILAARRQGKLRDLPDLRAIGVIASRAAPFVLLDGKRPTQQLAFW